MSVQFVLDGNDCSGKSSVAALLTHQMPQLNIKDRGMLTKLTDVFEDFLPKSLPENEVYIVLDADVNVCMQRMISRNKPKDKYDTFESIFKYKGRFMRLAIRYGTYY